jgi:PAS domain S-box-containing protein
MTTASPAPLTRSTRLDAVHPRALLVAGLLALEIVIGHLSVHYSPPGSHVAMFWPGVGLSVAALSLTRPQWRSAVVVGVLAVNVVANLGGRPLDVSLAFGLANAAGAAAACWVLTRGRNHESPQLQNLDDFCRLVAAAALGAGVGGGIGGATVALLADGDAFLTWRALFASYGAAILLIAPLAMQLPRYAKQAGTVETVLQWTSLFGVVLLIFRPEQGIPLSFLPFPLLVWGAARLTAREVSVQLLAYFTVVSVLTSAGLGPIATNIEAHGAPELIGTLLQAQVLAAVLVALPLSVVKTQQLITLDRLTHSHVVVSSILEATTATAILGTDLDGRIEFFNIGAEQLTGYRADEVTGRAAVALAEDGDGRLQVVIGLGEEPDTGRLTSLVRPFLHEDRTSFTSDWDFVRRDGELRTISVAISHRYGEDGQPVGFLGVADDVTERRRHEAMVAAALETEKQIVERLAQVDQTKNDFLSTVSHELRTPITSIIGYSQLLSSDDTGALPAMHQQIIGRIERNGRRLMGLIEDMLTMSQVEVGSFSFAKTPIDLRDPVSNAIEAVHGTVAVNDLDLDLDLGLEAVKVYGDPDKLERVFVNLLSNAAKFSHAGDKISVHLHAEDDQAVISVVDSGIGIGPEDQAHLFDRFFRGADAHALAIQGVGLGLPIASSIVAGHDGRIDVISELGHGSTFVVRLPLLGDGVGRDRVDDAAA